jgi:hypothetical protein
MISNRLSDPIGMDLGVIARANQSVKRVRCHPVRP